MRIQGGGLIYFIEYDKVRSMKNPRKIKIKITELKKPASGRVGRKKYNGNEPLPHEKRTIRCLNEYGFDVETIIPSNMPGSRNPDILMMGTFWEMKTPQTDDKETIATHFRKAVKQSGGKAIFDIRYTKNANSVEKDIMGLFITTRGMRRIMIIKKGSKSDEDCEKILDISK